MNSLSTLLIMSGLLSACQPSNKNEAPSQTTTVAKPHTQYRLVFVKRERKYEYANELYLHDFEAKVNQMIAEGWQPVGGAAMSGMEGTPVQTMVKIE